MHQNNFETLESWAFNWEFKQFDNPYEYKNYFYNIYSPIGGLDELIKQYVHNFECIPEEELKRIIDEFRNVYSTENRIEGLKGYYFDDRIGSDIERYRLVLKNDVRLEMFHNEFLFKENRQKFRVNKIATEEDEVRNPSLIKGSVYSQYKPIERDDEYNYFENFNPNEEAKKRLVEYDAFGCFNLELEKYADNYAEVSIVSLTNELNRVNDFIAQANGLDLTKEKRTFAYSELNEMIEYRRFVSGFYDEKEFNGYFHFYEMETKFAVAKYVLYKQWLENKLNWIMSKDSLEEKAGLVNSLLLVVSYFNEEDCIVNLFKSGNDEFLKDAKSDKDVLHQALRHNKPFSGILKIYSYITERLDTTDNTGKFEELLEAKFRKHCLIENPEADLSKYIEKEIEYVKGHFLNEKFPNMNVKNRIPQLEDWAVFLEDKLKEMKSFDNKRVSMFSSHTKLYEAFIMSCNEKEENKIEQAYDYIKEIWFFVNSDNATFDGKAIEFKMRPLMVNPVWVGKPEFDKWFTTPKTFDGRRERIKLVEEDFIEEFSEWVTAQIESRKLRVERKRKYKEFNEYLDVRKLKIKPEKRHDSKPKSNYKSLSDIFDERYSVTECFDVLRKVEPPIINNADEYNLGSKSKGSIVAWICALKEKGIIKSSISDKVLAELLNNSIKGLNLGSDGRSLRNPGTTSYRKYYTDILKLLP